MLFFLIITFLVILIVTIIDLIFAVGTVKTSFDSGTAGNHYTGRKPVGGGVAPCSYNDTVSVVVIKP